MTGRRLPKSELYGLVCEGDDLRLDQREIASALNISQPRVCQILRDIKGPQPTLADVPQFRERCAAFIADNS